MAAPEPPLEPPAMRDGQWGFLTLPYVTFLLLMPKDNSWRFVLAMTTAPADSRLFTTSADSLDVMSSNAGHPLVMRCLLQLSQPKRLSALNKFKAGEARILIATDVAARGA